jgi:hypothetical protein
VAPHDLTPLQLLVHDMTDQLQIMHWRRQHIPIRDRDEVKTDLLLRFQELNGATKQEWRARMVELAAYALYAAFSDESHG